MRNILLGTVAGLVLGMIGAVGYSHFLGNDSLLADLQAKLDAANAALAKSDQDKKDLTRENSSLADQIDQLEKSISDLKHQAEATTAPAPAAQTARTQPTPDMGALAGVMRGLFRGGFQNPQQRMILLKARLHLSAEQMAKIQAALTADSNARRDLMRQAFQNGGKVDPAAAAKANTLDSVMADLLNPEQQRQYQQLQADEKVARADTSVTTQVNSVSPLLQLNETQRQQMYDALYQVQMSAPDPNSLITNPNAVSVLTAQAQANNAALQKVLTADQWSLYQQQNQAFGGGPGGPRGGSNAPGGPAGGNTASANVAPGAANSAGGVGSGTTTSAGNGYGGASTFTGGSVISSSTAPANAAPQVVVNPGAPPTSTDPATTNAAPSTPTTSTNAAPQTQ